MILREVHESKLIFSNQKARLVICQPDLYAIEDQ